MATEIGQRLEEFGQRYRLELQAFDDEPKKGDDFDALFADMQRTIEEQRETRFLSFASKIREYEEKRSKIVEIASDYILRTVVYFPPSEEEYMEAYLAGKGMRTLVNAVHEKFKQDPEAKELIDSIGRSIIYVEVQKGVQKGKYKLAIDFKRIDDPLFLAQILWLNYRSIRKELPRAPKERES